MSYDETHGKEVAAIAISFLAGTLAFSSLSGAPQTPEKSQNDFSHVVKMNKTYSRSGDAITLEEVRGPSEDMVIGGTYEVKGSYQLSSREKAMLAAFVTISASQRDVHPAASPEQMVVVSKGQGRFTLRFHMWQKGDPHVSFYPDGGGESFGGVYF